LVDVTEESKLARIIGHPDDLVSMTTSGSVVVNSSHHQAIDIPGDGLRVTAHCSEDDLIEAVEWATDEHFVLGVQWHPERSYDASAASRHLFRAFVEAAIRYRPRVVLESLVL
jgi:putative glutamine amidotransferase